jgi:NAD-dependent DNA ligase
MLSLENSYNTQDLLDRDDFVTKHLSKSVIAKSDGNAAIQEELKYSYYIEPKFDGISVEIIYKN